MGKGDRVMTRVAAVLKQAMAAEGYILPGDPVPDGTLHRFSHEDRNDATAGWYVLHAGGIPAGIFGDWRSGRTLTWFERRETEFSPKEREDYRRCIEQEKATRLQAERGNEAE